jgi:hypothetical protein
MKSFLSFFFAILFFTAFVNGSVIAGRGEGDVASRGEY